MKTYNWKGGQLQAGFRLTKNEKLGLVLVLGEAGRGRWEERIALSRKNPPVLDSEILRAANIDAIRLPAVEGKPEKVFHVFVAPSPTKDILLRVSSQWTYTRGTVGTVARLAGAPTKVCEGYGAHGMAGRIGSWGDSLWVLHPGDALHIRPEGGYKIESWVVWLPPEGDDPQTATHREYDLLQAIQAAEPAPAATPAYLCWTANESGVKPGVALSLGSRGTGLVVSLGEAGRGRTLTEVPVLDGPFIPCPRRGSEIHSFIGVGVDKGTGVCQSCGSRFPTPEAVQYCGNRGVHPDEGFVPGRLTAASIQEIATGIALRDAPASQTVLGQTILVQISTQGPYTKGSSGEVIPWKGQPVELAKGMTAGGIAGRTNQADVGLWLLAPGDVVCLSPEGGYKSRKLAVWNEDGELKSEDWGVWKLRDAELDPDFYVAKGWARGVE